MNLNISKDLISLSFPFSAETINQVKKIGLKWNPKLKNWESPFSYQVIDGLKREFPDLDVATMQFPSIDAWEPSSYLMSHQKEAGNIALEYPRYGFFDDTGTGKTLEALEIVLQKRVKTLVICKLSLIENAWMRDAANFYPCLKVVNLWEVMKKRKRLPDHDIGIINFESFRTHHQKLTDYQMVLIDESSSLKDPRSQITKSVVAYTDRVPFVYLFSGTPAPNNELEYWSQFRIIDQSLLGRSYYSFRNKFCYAGGFGGYIWKMKPDMKEEFLEKIGQKSRVIRKEDVLDLPERTMNIRTVYLDPKEMAAYATMERDLLLEIEGQESVAANSAVKLLKLRQGTSGFFYDVDKKPIVTGESKLQALRDLLDEIGNHQVIIWTQFHYEADQIQKMLKENVRVDGTTHDQNEKNENVRDFMDGKAQYLISHPASLGHGVNLQNCNYMIYFSLSYSFEQHYQSQDRIYRRGQKNKCSYYFLVADKTVDGEILKALEKKEDVVNAVFRYLKNAKGGK